MLAKLCSTRAQRDADGFTLIELLVVVIVIGLLAAIALPIFIDQTKTSVDASVKADVRNTVTNITNAQAQKATSVKAAVSDANTSVALVATTTEVASKSTTTTLNNVPALGDTYSVYGWNGNGSKYQGSASNPGFTFSSLTGKFTQGSAAAPSADGAITDPGSTGGSTGGSAPAAPSFTTDALPTAKYNAAYTATITTSGNPKPTFKVDGLTGTGLSALDNGDGTATISGTVTTLSNISPVVTLTNSVSTASKTYGITVDPNPLVLTNENDDPYYSKWTGGTRSGNFYAGSYSRQATGSGSTTTSTVSVPTLIGQKYRVDVMLYYQPYYGGGSCCSGVSSAYFIARGNINTWPTFSGNNDTNVKNRWLSQSLTFVADASTTKLEMGAYLNGTFGTTSLYADNITVTPVSN